MTSVAVLAGCTAAEDLTHCPCDVERSTMIFQIRTVAVCFDAVTSKAANKLFSTDLATIVVG